MLVYTFVYYTNMRNMLPTGKALELRREIPVSVSYIH